MRMMMRREFIITRIMFLPIIITLLLTVMPTVAFNNVRHGEVQSYNGGYAIACSTSSYGAGGADIWLVKLVIPEFPLATILLVLMAPVTLSIVFVKKSASKKTKT